MHINQLKIIGCGGHGKVVVDALSLMPHQLQVSLCDSNPDLLGKEFAGLVVSSNMGSLSNFTGYVHVAIGANQIRQRIIESLGSNLSLFTVIHPAAIISRYSIIESGVFIAAQAVLAPETYIGKATIINHGAVVDHEVKIGEFTHIAPNSTLGGNVTVGNGVLIGAGSVILPGVMVGDGAIIAAGAVVLKDVKEYTTVKGVPAV